MVLKVFAQGRDETKLSLTIKTDAVTISTRDVDPHRQAIDFLDYK